MTQERNIFKEVQEQFNIREVAEDLGIRFTRKDRAWSIANDGRGEYAFAIYPQSNTWYDFMLQQGGDITDLVAVMKYNGDKKAALQDLMPDWNEGKIHNQLSKRDEFMKSNEYFNAELFKRQGEGGAWGNALNYLHVRGITDETIKALQICLEINNGTFRIRFPYWNRTGSRILYYTTRRYDTNGNGEDEKQPKYMKASLDYHPYLENAILGLNTLDRKKDYLIITEGMFDWLQCYQQGYSAISPNGCDFGSLWSKAIEAIRDFKYVILAFDSDQAGQDATYKAAQELLKAKIPFKVATLLTKDVAEFCENGGNVEAIVNSARDGYKWFIEYITPKKTFEDSTVKEREQAFEKCKQFIEQISPYTHSADIHNILIATRKYFPREWISGLFTFARKGFDQADVRDTVVKAHQLMYHERTGFYEYTDRGIWEAITNTDVEGYISEVYGKYATGNKLSSTAKLVKCDLSVNSKLPITTFNRKPCIAFINGTLHIDMNTGKTEFRPHSATDYVTVMLPYKYNVDAKCPRWREFIKKVMDDRTDKEALLQEFAGYILLPNCKYDKALLLKGSGSNGKSVFTNILSKALGGSGEDNKGYVSAVEPSKLGKDFRLMPFKDAWLNISTETESDLRGAEGVFKKLVAGEVLEDSYKHKNPIAFNPRTKLIMCCNNFPSVNDTTDGFMRRWLIVEFDKHFVTEDEKFNASDEIIDPNLEDKLSEELPGIINWMIEGLVRLLKQDHFTKIREHSRLIKEFRCVNNPMYLFALEKGTKIFLNEDGTGKTVNKHEIYVMFKKWLEDHGEPPMGACRFYSNFLTVLKSLKCKATITEINGDWIASDIKKPEAKPAEEEHYEGEYEDIQAEIEQARKDSEEDMKQLREFRRREGLEEDDEE